MHHIGPFHVPCPLIHAQSSGPVFSGHGLTVRVFSYCTALTSCSSSCRCRNRICCWARASFSLFLLWHPPTPRQARPGLFFSLLHESLDLVMHGGGGSFE